MKLKLKSWCSVGTRSKRGLVESKNSERSSARHRDAGQVESANSPTATATPGGEIPTIRVYKGLLCRREMGQTQYRPPYRAMPS